MPPCRKFKTFRWTFGTKQPDGYHRVGYHGKAHLVHQIICRAFNGLPPEDKPFVDHINRIRDDNRPENLHWVSIKENNNNRDFVDQSIERYKVRACEDKKAYDRAYRKAHRGEYNAHQKAYYAKMKSKGLTHRKRP